MVVLIKAAQLMLSLSILVLIHEWGHYIAAKIFKTKVEKFYLFFDPWFSLFKFKKGETEYGIGWLPLGGYVKIAGMIDESMDKDQMKQPPQSWEFRSKPAWQRLIIMMGGIIMNIVLGIFIYSMILFAWGKEYIPNSSLKYGIACDSTAIKIGLQSGDKIVAVGGKPIQDYKEVFSRVVLDGATSIEVNRNGQIKDILLDGSALKEIVESGNPDIISPRVPSIINMVAEGSNAEKAKLMEKDKIIKVDSVPVAYFDELIPNISGKKNGTVDLQILRGTDTVNINVAVTEQGTIGIGAVSPVDIFETKTINYGFLASFPAGVSEAGNKLGGYIKSFKLIFSPEVQGYKHLGGFISIGKVMPAQWNWTAFWSITAFLSLALAFMNFLPIPALDGGHILFTLYEMVTRQKPSEKFLEYAQITGMVILIALMLFANGNDIIKLFN